MTFACPYIFPLRKTPRGKPHIRLKSFAERHAFDIKASTRWYPPLVPHPWAFRPKKDDIA